MMVDNVYILDNGAYTAKVELSKATTPRIIPNCIMKAKSERRRPFTGNQVDECRDASGLFYLLPFQKGFLVNWDVQKNVWDYIFSKECCMGNFSETPLIVTEPFFNFPSIQEAMSEIFFEEYECQSLLRINAGDLCNYHYRKEHPEAICCLLIDCGYSFTNIAPYIKDKKHKLGIRRIDVGGKVLTNHLKEIISYRNYDEEFDEAGRPPSLCKDNHERVCFTHDPILCYDNHDRKLLETGPKQLHVMDETHVINQVKEDACYVAHDFMKEMELARKKHPENTIARDYVLPDYTSIRRGYLRELDRTDSVDQIINIAGGCPQRFFSCPGYRNGDELQNPSLRQFSSFYKDLEDKQTLRLNNERFSIPELLFHPSDVGISQMGIVEAVVDAINACPPDTHPHLYANVLLVGGCTKFPGFRDRLYKDLRSLTPSEFNLNVYLPDDPVTYAWHGGAHLSRDPEFYTFVVTKEEFEEEGHNICFERFDI